MFLNETDPCLPGEAGGVTGLHVGAVFIILLASFLGVCLPLVGKRYSLASEFPFLMGKHFGTGVLLSLALIHLLVPSLGALASPCLSATWQSYPFAALIAIYSCLAMHAIETNVQRRVEQRNARLRASRPPIVVKDEESHGVSEPTAASSPDTLPPDATEPSSSFAVADPAFVPSDSPHQPDAEVITSSDDDVVVGAPHPHGHSHGDHAHNNKPRGHGHAHGGLLPRGFTNMSTKKMVSAYVLEFGLTMHSVSIGIALGVAPYYQMVPLLIALSFHQFFEGFALGACLSEAGFSAAHELALSVLFGLSAPVGIAVGIGAQASYNANSVTAIVTVGVLDSVSAGIVLYVALVQMFSEFDLDVHKLSTEWGRLTLYVCVWLGAAAMAVIGIWL